MTDDGHAGIRIAPEPAAAGPPGPSVPREELLERNAVLAGNGGAPFAGLNQVKAVAVGDYVGLGRGRRGNAVSWASSRSWRGGGGGSRSVADDRDADVDFGPEAAAGLAYHGIPGEELCRGNAVGGSDSVAPRALGDEVKRVAVGHHAWLDGLRC